MITGKWMWRRRRVLVVVALVSMVGLGLARWRRDPWLIRAVIRPRAWYWEQGFARDGRSYLTLVRGGLLRWDVATGREAGFIPFAHQIQPQGWVEDEGGGTATAIMTAPVVGPAGSRDTSTLLRVDVATGAVRARCSAPPGRVIICPRLGDGGRAIAAVLIGAAASELATWDLVTGAVACRAVAGPTNLVRPGRRHPIGYSDDGRTWAYLDPTQGGILLWDADLDRPRGPILRDPAAPPASEVAAAFSPDSRTLAVARRDDGRVEFWDVPAARLLRSIAAHPSGFIPNRTVFSPDGRWLVSVAQDSRNDWRSWAEDQYNFRVPAAYRISHRHEAVVVAVATGAVSARWAGVMYEPQFSPDGRTIAIREADGTIALRAVPGEP